MPTDSTDVALGLGLALLVGALVGLERERHAAVEKRRGAAGIRTFPLIALVGALCALLSPSTGPWLLLAGFLVLAALIGVSHWAEVRTDGAHAGITSEVAALLVYLLGAIPFAGALPLDFPSRLVLTGAVGAVVMSALALREPLHALAKKFSSEDMYATVRFVLLAAVAFPLLPDRELGPYGVLNPFELGMVVVLIAALSFVGYLAVRILGPHRGIGITGAFGGLVSSTAVALTFSERGREHRALAAPCAVAVALASTVMFPRMLAEVSVIRGPLVPALAPVLVAMLLTGSAGCLLLWMRSRGGKADDEAAPRFTNPFRIAQALKLGLVFAAVRLLAAFAHDRFGEGGLYASALLAGLSDVDSITISVSRMHAAGLADSVAVTAITLAAVGNTLVKLGIAMVVGGRAVGLRVAAVLGPAVVVGLVVAWLA